LFFASFCVSGETNAATCLVTKETAFYAARPIKKLNLKHSFYAAIFSVFLTEFRKKFLNPVYFYISKALLKKIIFFIFFFFAST
jgi:hypothetical protein